MLQAKREIGCNVDRSQPDIGHGAFSVHVHTYISAAKKMQWTEGLTCPAQPEMTGTRSPVHASVCPHTWAQIQSAQGNVAFPRPLQGYHNAAVTWLGGQDLLWHVRHMGAYQDSHEGFHTMPSTLRMC